MKRLFTFLVTLGCVLALTAQPILVGHRGSYYGVESTAEAFRNGADRGFQYLETDVKVTKDGKFILSHDDDNTRLGGSHTITGSTLAELQSDLLTQTRGGVTYTGHMCSLDELLDICNEKNVRPLIELKWATGINNNDCSNIPALIAAIEAKGFRNKCIILTSMKPCLEYIRTRYPDITLQFLTGQYWANHFSWCVQYGIDVDIQAGYFDKSTVRKFHAEGLKVNMWTTNSESGYLTYGNMGCDFITTDYLDGHNLPELNPEVTFPPNTLDYPEIEGTVKGSYNLGAPSSQGNLSNPGSVKRAVFDGTKWYTLFNDGTAAAVTSNGSVSALSSASGRVISDIALSADGCLIGAYETNKSLPELVKWKNASSAPEVIFTPGDTESSAEAHQFTIAVSGKASQSLKVYVADNNGRITGLELGNGNAEPLSTCVAEFTAGADALGSGMTVTPSSRDNVLVYGRTGASPIEYTMPWGVDSGDAKTYASMTELPADYTDGNGIAYLRYGAKVYMVLPVESDGKIVPALYDASAGIGSMYLVGTQLEGGVDAGAFAAAGVKAAGNDINISVITENGFATWKFNVAEAVEDPDPALNLVLERVWINSLTTGNAPAHIDGTNAQQGTAVNGYFYVNDCSDKKIYIFDASGCIGDIPGGSGWGCCRDDAGNIIVRDDKSTSATHKFIIYPAGAMPGNYGEPVSIEITTPLDGQTNFINASGNVLGQIGHIYLFPNRQTAVSVITMSNGSVLDTRVSADLALTGSTAGYVIPMNDDPENWIYQVRATGLYYYRGGDSEGCLISRSSTNQPDRNTTGGGAYFRCGGNEILVHNSGANYKGGFSVRDLSLNKVYASVEPIGTLGYEAGGNYSTFNWLFTEKNGQADYTLYQYCPSNGMAVYRLYDPSQSGISNVTVASGTVTVHTDGTTLTATADGTLLSGLTLYSADGRVAATTEGTTLNISALHGFYILTTPAGPRKVVL